MKAHSCSSNGCCGHMKNLLEDNAQGKAKGIRKWYADAHTAQCNQCKIYARGLKEPAKDGEEASS